MINHKRAQKIVDSIIPGKTTIAIFTHNKLWLRSVRTIWEAFYDASFWQWFFLTHTFPERNIVKKHVFFCVQTMFFQEHGPMDQWTNHLKNPNPSDKAQSRRCKSWGVMWTSSLITRNLKKKAKTICHLQKKRECHHPFFFGGISV